MRTSGFLIAFVVAFATPYADAAERPVVLELFTSEGCSSCPPAEALLTRLAARKDLLALSFHVTYWNSLGWRDPFSFEAASSRQDVYKRRLGDGNYTPQMIVDGRTGMVGSDDVAIADAIVDARPNATDPLSVGIIRKGDAIAISVGASKGRGDILLIGFDPKHETKIGRGENRGLRLVEANVVRSIRRVAGYTGQAVQIDAVTGEGLDFAVLVQAPDGRILGAARS